MRTLEVLPTDVGVKTGTVAQAKVRYNIGRDSVVQIAEAAGAIVRIGRKVLINFTKMDQYIDDELSQ